MKRILLIFGFIFIGISAFSQTGNPKHTLVIGIGNSEKDVFNNTITLINSLDDVKIILKCETQKALLIEKDDVFYKDDMEFLKFLQSKIEGLVLNKKDISIMENECFYEVLKQKL
jgi:hypothetical protein